MRRGAAMPMWCSFTPISGRKIPRRRRGRETLSCDVQRLRPNGQKEDPAGIKDRKDVAKAIQIIKEKQACFVSRGDHSGTHMGQLKFWKAADADIEKDKGAWYKSIGQGMGATLNFPSPVAMCYRIVGRGLISRTEVTCRSWLMAISAYSDQYDVMLVDPASPPDV